MPPSRRARAPRAPRVIAHRGASADHPENTLAAIDAALAPPDPADGLEIDVRLTADGVPVVFHDDDLERLTGRAGTIEDLPLAELEDLRVDGEPIPTLEEALACFRGWVPFPTPGSLNVELKPTAEGASLIDAVRPLLDPLARAGAGPRLAHLVVSSFDPRVILAAQLADVPWRLALLYDDLAALAALRYLRAGSTPVDLHPQHRLLTPRHLQEYGHPGRMFRTWTVDDPDEARRVRDLGVDAIITNRPRELRRALAAG